MYDLIVIGGGPGGLAAMSYAQAKQLDAVLICPKFGGRAGDQLHQPAALADAASGSLLALEELISRLKAYLIAQPGCVYTDLVTSVSASQGEFHVVTERSGTLSACAVILATGAHPRLLGLPHEWELIGHGLGYSITTHAHALAGQSVAVVGSNMRALRGVAELSQTARQVVVIAPEPGELESPLGQCLRAHPAVELLEGYHIVEVVADAMKLRTITVARASEVRQLAVQAIFVDLGLVASSQMVRHLVQLNPDGRVIIDERNRTSLPGLFAAGDVTSIPSEQIMVALGAGMQAAVSMYAYVLEQRLHVDAHAQPETAR